MDHNRSQPRQPKGAPTGGQWRATGRPEGTRLAIPTRHSFDVVGYAYQADIWCPECIAKKFAPGQQATEAALDHAAEQRGIDRYDEATFDSDDFPKVVFRDQVEDEACGRCGRPLED
jgi:hypothetical protein